MARQRSDFKRFSNFLAEGRFKRNIASVCLLVFFLVLCSGLAIKAWDHYLNSDVKPVANLAPEVVPPRKADREERNEIAKGFNAGVNDLEGNRDSTNQGAIITAATKALKAHLGGGVSNSSANVSHVLEAGKSWTVAGEYTSPSGSRADFEAIVVAAGESRYTVTMLTLSDDVVVRDEISEQPDATALPPRAHEPRKWTSINGKTVTATFVSAGAGKVNLLKEDGKEVTIEKAKFSEADQKYLDDLARR